MKWEIAKLGKIAIIRTGKLDSNAAVIGGRYPFLLVTQIHYQLMYGHMIQKPFCLQGIMQVEIIRRSTIKASLMLIKEHT